MHGEHEPCLILWSPLQCIGSQFLESVRSGKFGVSKAGTTGDYLVQEALVVGRASRCLYESNKRGASNSEFVFKQVPWMYQHNKRDRRSSQVNSSPSLQCSDFHYPSALTNLTIQQLPFSAAHKLPTTDRTQEGRLASAIDRDSGEYILAIGVPKDLQNTSLRDSILAGSGDAAFLLNELLALVVLGEAVAFYIRHSTSGVGVDIDGDGDSGGGDGSGGGEGDKGEQWKKLLIGKHKEHKGEAWWFNRSIMHPLY